MKLPMLYFVRLKTIRKECFIMNSITHILQSIKSFSSSLFKFSTYAEPLSILKSVPDKVTDLLNTDDFIFHLDQASLHINWLNDFFKNNVTNLLKREVSKLKKNKAIDKTIPYADFRIDAPPVFEKIPPKQLSFDEILQQSVDDGKPIKPINRRKDISYKGTCPHCGAPNEFLYDNSNGRGQFLCKGCKDTFNISQSYGAETGIFCPCCHSKLSPHHDRKGYIVYKCPNDNCDIYTTNKALLNKGKAEHLKTSSGGYNLRYHYRDFKFDLGDLKDSCDALDTKVNLAKIHAHPRTLGLILTYYVNYGLSSRKTSVILYDIHGIKISHQTVLNYADATSKHIKYLVDNYDYTLSNTLAGDETYIKVRGKDNYVFFWSDPIKKTIASYTIYPTRDTLCACQSIYDCLRHYDTIPEDLTLITDGNPIYNAAQVFFHINDIDFTLHQVIGIKNKDEVSKQYRPFKQIEERLNRTYKQNYYGTNGYHKIECANSYMVLFVCFFNFLRKHSSLRYKTPVDDGLFEEEIRMQDKWLQLIDLSVTMMREAQA